MAQQIHCWSRLRFGILNNRAEHSLGPAKGQQLILRIRVRMMMMTMTTKTTTMTTTRMTTTKTTIKITICIYF